jgi:hypothetical protein
MRIVIVSATLLFLAACGAIPPTMVSGDDISTEHGTARGIDAFKGAQQYCASRGKGVQTVRSDCPFRCISVYKCTGS